MPDRFLLDLQKLEVPADRTVAIPSFSTFSPSLCLSTGSAVC